MWGRVVERRSAELATLKRDPDKLKAITAPFPRITYDAAVTHFRVVLAGTNSYNRTLFETAWKALDDPDQILQDLIPSHRETEIAYLNYLSGKQRFDAAKKVWKRVLDHPDALEPRYAGPYIDRLLGAGMGPEAHEAWTELLANQPDLFTFRGKGT